jgi:hypothetical protein
VRGVLRSGIVALCLSCTAAAAVAEQGASTRLFRVWLKEGVTADPHAESVDGHPCGGVSYRRAGAVPVEDEYVVPERVVEYDENGGEIGVWRVPVDTYPYAIAGNELLVSDNYESLWIDRDGVAREVPLTHHTEGDGDTFACPQEWCLILIDKTDGRPRRVGANHVCS